MALYQEHDLSCLSSSRLSDHEDYDEVGQSETSKNNSSPHSDLRDSDLEMALVISEREREREEQQRRQEEEMLEKALKLSLTEQWP